MKNHRIACRPMKKRFKSKINHLRVLVGMQSDLQATHSKLFLTSPLSSESSLLMLEQYKYTATYGSRRTLSIKKEATMEHNYPSDSDNEITVPRVKLFDHDRPIHEVLGGGKVADVLLWRKRNVSAGVLLGMTLIWFLFEVVDNFLPLICHISITMLLVLFIWSTVADLLKWNRPEIPEVILQESYFQDLAFIFYRRFNQFLKTILHISCGADLPRFVLVVVSLYIVSVIGSYFNFVNLLYIGFLGIQTLPIVYEKYEEEIDSLVGTIILDLRKKYRRFDKRYISKIPRGPVKEKKTR